jgi:hypothetical protein
VFDERIQKAVDLLSSLILTHSRMLASEQHNALPNQDSSDEYMTERARWIKELRAIRERLETLVTGVV